MGQLKFSCFGDRELKRFLHRDTERPRELYFTCPAQSKPLHTRLRQIRQERTRERVSVLKENVNAVSVFLTAKIVRGLLQS